MVSQYGACMSEYGEEFRPDPWNGGQGNSNVRYVPEV